MANEVSKQLSAMQTGQYQLPDDEKKRLQALSAMKNRAYNTPDREDYRAIVRDPMLSTENSALGEEAAKAGWGQSRFDTGTFEPGMDLEDARARAQSGGSKILNGAMKGGVTAATTAVETVAGVIDGLLEGTAELTRQALFGEKLDLSKAVGKGVNNYVAQTMTHIQELSEQWFPNYRTEYERSDKYQDEWMKHIFSANFIGDSFLKNFGFTVGAIAGGAAWSKALGWGLKAMTASDMLKGVVAAAEGSEEASAALQNALRLVESGKIKTIAEDPAVAKIISQASKSLNKMATKHQLFGGIIGAMGEGTFEGVMARKEFLDNRLAEIDADFEDRYRNLEQDVIGDYKDTDLVRSVPVVDEYGNIHYEYRFNDDGQEILARERAKLAAEHQQARELAMDLGDRVAATTFMWNLPILTVSNTMQFGRMLSGGWKTTRNVAKTAGEILKQDGKLAANLTGKQIAKGTILGNTVLGTVKRGATEAAEEMSQGFISSAAKRAADTRLTAFNDDAYDMDELKKLGNWIGLNLDGGMEYLKEGRNWQEGFLGMITGVVGIPGRQWNGGIAEAYREAKGKAGDSQAAADALNTVVNSDRFQNAIKGWVRHQKYETEMQDGVRRDDKYAWETASDKQLINDIITFANAGRLQDLKDIVDYYAEMSDDDSDGLEVTDAVTSDANATDVKNNPQKAVSKVKEQARNIKESIQMYNDMYDAMSTIAPVGVTRDQIEEMIAASMNIKAFESRFLSLFDEVIKGVEPHVKAVSVRDEQGKFIKKKERIEKAREIYSDLAESMTNISIPLNPNLIDEFEALPAIAQLKSEIDRTGDSELQDKYEDLKKLALDRKAFVNKLLTLKNLSPNEFGAQAQSADKINEEQKKKAAEEEIEGLTSLAKVREMYKAEGDKNLGDTASFLTRIRSVRDSNLNVARFLDIHDAYTDLRSMYTRQSGSLTGLERDIVERLFENAKERDDVLDESKIESYDEWQARVFKSAGTNVDNILTAQSSRMDTSRETYDAAVQKVKKAIAGVRGAEESASGRKDNRRNPAPAPAEEKKNVVNGEAKEAADPATEGPDPSKKKKSTLSADENSAVDAIGRTWTKGEKVYCYDSTKQNPVPEEFQIEGFMLNKKGEVVAMLSGPRNMNVNLTHQTPFINKNLPNGGASTTVGEDEEVPVVAPTKDELLDEAIEEVQPTAQEQRARNERNGYDQKTYYQTAIPEFTADSAREYYNARTAEKKKNALQRLVDFLTPERRKDKTIQKLISENAWTNAVKHVQKGDKVKFIALPGYTGKDGKVVIFLAVEKDGKRYIFNVMRRTGAEQYEGLQDFLDAFDMAYNSSSEKSSNKEFVFSKEATVFGKREGIIDYSYTDDYSGERPIQNIEAYDENAPIVWINGNGEFQTLHGDARAMQSVATWMNMTSQDRYSRRGQLYYLAEDGLGGYIPIRLGLEHFTPKNMDTDTSDFAAVRRSLTSIQGIAGRFFHRINEINNNPEIEDKESAKQNVLAEENKALHDEIANNLRKYVDLTHGFFKFMFSKDGAPILMYDRNPAVKGVKRDSEGFEGFILGENNYDMLLKKFAEERVAFDLRPTHNLDEFLKKGYITSNAKKMLPKQVDVYMTRYKDGDFVPTLEQQDLIPQDKGANLEDEIKDDATEPVVPPVDDDPFANPIEEPTGGFVFVDDFDESEFGLFEQPAEPIPAPPAEEGPKTFWDSIKKETQDKLLERHGEDIIDYMNDDSVSPEDKQNKIDCVEVS